jgi:hypothetical protein
MFGRRAALSALSLIYLAVVANALAAQEQPEANKGDERSQFVRLVREGGEATVLETSIIRHAPREAGCTQPTVDLVSAVHVAEKSYYEELNRRFEKYDVVLYELVAPEGTRIPKGGPVGNQSSVSMVQTGMTGLLDLEFQLRAIDYTRKNLVHADMSPEQFARSMEQRGESMFQTFMRMFGYAMARQQGENGATEAQMLMAFFSKDRALALKRLMAEQFQDMEGSLTAVNGPNGSTLITERNKVALEVLRKQIAAGKKKIAIFYGAGHMPDIQARLASDFGLVPISTEWIVAWDLQAKSGDPRSK